MTHTRLILIVFVVATALIAIGALVNPARGMPETPETSSAGDGGKIMKPLITEQAGVVLEKMRMAFTSLKSLDVVGQVIVESTVADKDPEKEFAEFRGAYEAPNRFSFDMSDGTRLGPNGKISVPSHKYQCCSGSEAWLYLGNKNIYYHTTKVPAKLKWLEFPARRSASLNVNDPNLARAVYSDAHDRLLDRVQTVERSPDEKIDDKNLIVLRLTSAPRNTTVLYVDPETFLIRRLVQTPFRSPRATSGTTITIDYSHVVANGEIDRSRFTWSPPDNATEGAERYMAE